ncbi:PD-(D/E)XK nuclease family transposase [uncultured Lamprocystis sp.]|jgi:hypothetical protein|uniref:PD-(D/E)XK nuclease family transposase n=1 Tax=uncultured Lamprocystis sp. TaxID=543132 RepID=UPI0025DED258|nr:PD-(D/E)XK nuclease family transposase [uncultured Lamprocystis sp.]
MDHPIDPKTDCVFKALLGAEDNRNLLIHFLNATLGADLPSPVTQVDIINPYNEREFLTDKLSIVDVKARDAHARLDQAEIQLVTHRDLPARILYTWDDLYSQQLLVPAPSGHPIHRHRCRRSGATVEATVGATSVAPSTHRQTLPLKSPKSLDLLTATPGRRPER